MNWSDNKTANTVAAPALTKQKREDAVAGMQPATSINNWATRGVPAKVDAVADVVALLTLKKDKEDNAATLEKRKCADDTADTNPVTNNNDLATWRILREADAAALSKEQAANIAALANGERVGTVTDANLATSNRGWTTGSAPRKVDVVILPVIKEEKEANVTMILRSANISNVQKLQHTPLKDRNRDNEDDAIIPEKQNGGGLLLSPTTYSDLITLSHLAISDTKRDTETTGSNDQVGQIPVKNKYESGSNEDVEGKGLAVGEPSVKFGTTKAVETIVTTLPPHLRAKAKTDKLQETSMIPSKDTRERLVVNSKGSPVRVVTPTPAAGKKACQTSPIQIKAMQITPAPTTLKSTASAAPPTGAWTKFINSGDRLAVNRPGRTQPTGYTLPTQFANNTYGSPKPPRPNPSAITVDPAMEKTLFFKSWPGVEDRGGRAMPRTIIITGLPEDPTLAMVSTICRNTGLIESITIIYSTRKAMVWFIEAADAQKFHDNNGNGVEFVYERGGKTHSGVVFIEMKKELDVLASAMRTNVTEKGHTRVVRIVGWERKDLEKVAGVKGKSEEPYEVLLKRLADQCAFEKKVERVEGVDWCANRLGHNEANLIFCGIKEAYHVLGQLYKKPELEKCNVTFGKDP